MLAALIAAVAITVILLDILRPARQPHPLWVRVARAAPYAVVAMLSLWAAARAPQGRKPFQLDLSITPEDFARSITKVPHLRSVAILFLLAVIAFGIGRLLWAFALTMLLGLGWELAQTTVAGHHARLSDLTPNFVAGLVCLGVVALLRWALRLQKRVTSPAA